MPGLINGSNPSFYVGRRSEVRKENFVATAGQTLFMLTSLASDEHLDVYLNGVMLKETTDYSVAGAEVTLVTGAEVGDELTARIIG
jgi:hypothetical protein